VRAKGVSGIMKRRKQVTLTITYDARRNAVSSLFAAIMQNGVVNVHEIKRRGRGKVS
jgi:hypothetical protein